MRPLPILLALTLLLPALLALQAGATTTGPTFRHPTTLPVSSGYGEPSVAVAPDGAVYVTAPGASSALWRSDDGGLTFQRVADSLGSSGDSDVAIGADGTIYVSDLFPNVPVSVSLDRGESFAYEAQTASGGSIDRQWTAAWGTGHVFSAWRDGSTERVAVSHDHGVSYTRHVAATGVGFQGNIVATSANDLWIPYTTGGQVRLAASHDGGVTWTNTLVGRLIGGSYLFPAVALDAAGIVYVAWAEGGDSYVDASAIKVASSRDGGATFSTPRIVSTTNAFHIMPWLVAGDEGRVAVAWYEGVAPANARVDPNVAALTTWNVRVAMSLDADQPDATWMQSVAFPAFHTGSICTFGILCFPVDNPVALNRALLDFFETAMLADGRLVIATAADVALVNPTSAVQLKVVVQNGGPDLKA